MKTPSKCTAVTLLVWASAALAGCSNSATTEPDLSVPAALLSVQPTGGSVDVAVDAEVVVTFDHPIAEGMEAYAALYEGSITGPEVPGTWALSADHTALTFTPDAPLKPATTYVIHIGGGMMDADGDILDLGSHGRGMGGEWATGSMMTGGMGMHGQGGHSDHMGMGWENPTDGTYGMVFTFTTAP